MSGNQPQVTLFVSNLNIKIKKDEMRRSLYSLFGYYGKVLDVVHVRAKNVRSTSFIVFRDLASATSAFRALDGEAFFGKQLRITYAKTPSHATISHHEGPEAVYAIKLGLRSLADDAEQSKKSKMTVSSAQKTQMDLLKKSKRGRDGAEEEEEEEEDSDDEEEQGPEKKKGRIDGPEQAEEDGDDAMEEESDEDVPLPSVPSRHPSDASPSLFIEGLPAEVTAEMLLPLFQQYPGLTTVKLLPTPPGSGTKLGRAHALYESVNHASTAKEALDQFLLAPDTPMSVSWMKKA